jgi:hypothetical protein
VFLGFGFRNIFFGLMGGKYLFEFWSWVQVLRCEENSVFEQLGAVAPINFYCKKLNKQKFKFTVSHSETDAASQILTSLPALFSLSWEPKKSFTLPTAFALARLVLPLFGQPPTIHIFLPILAIVPQKLDLHPKIYHPDHQEDPQVTPDARQNRPAIPTVPRGPIVPHPNKNSK